MICFDGGWRTPTAALHRGRTGDEGWSVVQGDQAGRQVYDVRFLKLALYKYCFQCSIIIATSFILHNFSITLNAAYEKPVESARVKTTMWHQVTYALTLSYRL